MIDGVPGTPTDRMTDAPARRSRPAGAPRPGERPRRRSALVRGLAGLLVLLALLAVVVVRLADREDPPAAGEAPVLLEPYRYVVRPIGAEPSSAGPPTSAAARLPLQGGTTAEGRTLSTAEARPQAVLFLPRQGLRAQGSSLDVVLEPLAPDPLPRGYRAEGNRYRVRFGASATLAQQGAFATLQLRAASTRDDLVVLVRQDLLWQPLETTRGPGQVYGVPFPGAGDFQLASRGAEEAGGRSRTVPLVAGGAVLLLGLVVVGLRLGRSERLRRGAAGPWTSGGSRPSPGPAPGRW